MGVAQGTVDADISAGFEGVVLAVHDGKEVINCASGIGEP